jgi:pimeloyl-ACP methyl ester carboxylesterase
VAAWRLGQHSSPRLPQSDRCNVAATLAVSAFHKTGVRSRLGEIHLPVLVANGCNDRMIPAYQSYVISQEAPNAKLILYPDAGHGFLAQYNEQFASDVNAFLDEKGH